VQNKNAFPVTNNANSGGSPLVKDLGFLHAAFSTALKYADPSTR
jgi:endo-1,4-beta-xylanase